MSYLQAEVTTSGDLGREALYKPPKACVMGEAVCDGGSRSQECTGPLCELPDSKSCALIRDNGWQ